MDVLECYESHSGYTRKFSGYGQRHSCWAHAEECDDREESCLSDNSRKWEGMVLNLVGFNAQGQVRADQCTYDHLAPGQPQSSGDRTH